MTDKEFCDYLFPFLFEPVEELWAGAMARLKPEKIDEVRELAEAENGFPCLLLELDPGWELRGPGGLVIVTEPTQAGEESQIAEVGTMTVGEEYKRPLLDLCKRLSLMESGQVHASHHSGEVLLTFVVDLKRRRIRIVATVAKDRRAAFGVFELRDPNARTAVVN